MRSALGFLAAVLLLAAALLFAPRLLDAAAGPDAALRSILQRAESSGVSIPISGATLPLRSRRLHFDRISTHLEAAGQAAQARSTLDFEGTFDGVEVSSLGVERTEFDRVGGEWRVRNGFAPRLAAAVAALEARRRALQTGDGEGLARLAVSPQAERAARTGELLGPVGSGRVYRATAWYIRLERNQALVTEDYEIEASGADPPPEKAKRRLTLERRGSQFLFSGSLL